MMRKIPWIVGFGFAVAAPAPTHDEILTYWQRFKARTLKSYANEDVNFGVFKANVLNAHALNEEHGIECSDLLDGEDCNFGITKFSDVPRDELRRTRLGYQPQSDPNCDDEDVVNLEDMAPAPKAVNWVEKGAVTPIKDQGDCGSCWAYSAVSEIESSVFMATGKLPVLSTQQLVSCDKGDNGCNGGNPTPAYDYVIKAGGLDSAADYPDTSSDNGTVKKCSWNKKVVAKVKGYKCPIPECVLDCNHQNEDKLAQALANLGPFSICVFAEDAWFSYKKGIYATKTCSSKFEKMDHAIQLVGYNKTGPVPYWIIRNQWGKDWGYGGYIHVKMGENMCGLANQPTMAIIDQSNTDIIV